MVLVLKGTVERNGPKFVSVIIIVVQMGRTLLSKSAVNGMIPKPNIQPFGIRMM